MARLRRERGIPQVELAEMLGIVQPMVSAYENGGLRLHGELIVELTKFLDVSADQLLGLKETKIGTAKTEGYCANSSSSSFSRAAISRRSCELSKLSCKELRKNWIWGQGHYNAGLTFPLSLSESVEKTIGRKQPKRFLRRFDHFSRSCRNSAKKATVAVPARSQSF
jgi:transcriptional regulator with XRE-family HTH domain